MCFSIGTSAKVPVPPSLRVAKGGVVISIYQWFTWLRLFCYARNDTSKVC